MRHKYKAAKEHNAKNGNEAVSQFNNYCYSIAKSGM